MPFTTFHLGPALGIGLPLRKYIHAPTFIVGNLILDIEPFLVLVFGLSYPLHGYIHTFSFALLSGFLLGFIAYKLERFAQPIFRALQLEGIRVLRMKSFLLSGTMGTILHVLLDSPLYTDIRPFFPLSVNFLYNPSMSAWILALCIGMGVIGVGYYAIILISCAKS